MKNSVTEIFSRNHKNTSKITIDIVDETCHTGRNARGVQTMIVNDKEALKRLDSPMNLINRLRTASDKKNNAMSLFGVNRFRFADNKQNEQKPSEPQAAIDTRVSFNPFQAKELPPSFLPSSTPSETKLDNILENHESQIKLGLAHDSALKLLTDSLTALSTKLDDVRADKLPSVISAASKTVESIRRERNEAAKSNKDREVHYHFYTPEQKKIAEYEIIDVA